MHVCQICNQKPATIHLTDIQNNVKREVHMCEGCASKKGFVVGQSIAIPEVLGKADGGASERDALSCSTCGITWSDFRGTGRFGCANDYTVFRDRLMPLLADIHARAERHVGKHPDTGDEGQGRLQRELMDCRRRLREAIEREEYELAAQLRDELRELETRTHTEN